MEKELYFLRHGETDFNKQGIVQGRGIDSDLNEQGRQQAILFYEAYKHIPFDKIYVSTLKRTQQTVQPFITNHIPYEKYAGLDELAWGICEGKVMDNEIKRIFSALVGLWKAGHYDNKCEGGESPNQVAKRVLEVIEVIKNRTEEKKILVCTHGRVLRILLCVLLNTPLSDMENYPHENTGLYRLRFKNDTFTLLDACNLSHLSHIKSTRG